MERRKFFTQTGLAALAAGFMPPSLLNMLETNTRKLIFPKRLRAGMKIALIAPSSSISEDHLNRVQQNMAHWGFEGVEGKALRAKNGFLAGTDAERLADLHWAFEDKSIDAVWCIRGGYGAARILQDIDYKHIKNNPKALIGFSDITALHIAIHQKTGLVTFHGPISGGEHPEQTLAWFKATLLDGSSPVAISPVSNTNEQASEETLPQIIRPGKAQGRLMGGNLSLVAAMCGTPFQPEFKGKIAFLEDIDEAPYRIDRMLTQVLQATDLKQAAGIALGLFADCKPKGSSPSFTLMETLKERLGSLGIPVFYGLPFGHVPLNATLPLGILAELDADAQRLTLLEKAVV